MAMSMTKSLLFFSLSMLLQFSITLGLLKATCAPPPVITCKSNDCDIFDYQGIWDDRGDCKAQISAWPTSEAELVDAVANAVKNKQRIKVVSKLSHSEPKLVCAGSNGVIISTQNYESVIAVNKSAMTITVQGGAQMNDVLEAAAQQGLALNAMVYWNGVSAAGAISTGAHDSGLVGKGSGVYEYVVGMRLVVPASASEGYAKVISLTEGDDDLNAARLSLGSLGAISEVTFALEPMYKRSLWPVVRNDSDLENNAESFLRGHEFGDINWIPSHGKAVYISIDRVPVSVPGDGLNSIIGSASTVLNIETKAQYYEAIQDKADVDAICNVLINDTLALAINGSGLTNDGKSFTGYPVIGFNHHMQTSGGCQGGGYSMNCTPTSILDKNEAVCSWDRRVYATLYFGVELRVPISRLHEANLQLCAHLLTRHECPHYLFPLSLQLISLLLPSFFSVQTNLLQVSQFEMDCERRILVYFLIIGLFLPFLMADTENSSLVQKKWTTLPPPPAALCTSCVTCENPCSQVPPPSPPPSPPPPPPPQIECPPPPKPPQIECPPPPSGYHYIFSPPNPFYPYNYPYDYYNNADSLLLRRKFGLLCLIGFVLYIVV